MQLSAATLAQIFAAAVGATFRGVRNLGLVTDVTVDATEYRVVIDGRSLAYVDTATSFGGTEWVQGGNATPAQHAAITETAHTA